MPTAFRLLTLIAMLTLAWPAAAQLACSDEPISADFFLPLPWRPDAPNFNLATACVGEPYSQRIVINPTQITLPGLPTVERVYLPTSNGVLDLPKGITYSCYPHNCVFNSPAPSAQCIELFGTPEDAPELSPPGTYDLKFHFELDVRFVGVVPAVYPTAVDPEAHVYLKLEEAGNCPEPDATVAGVAVLGTLAALARGGRLRAKDDARA